MTLPGPDRWLSDQLHVYVLTLKRRPDRRAWIQQQLPGGLRVTYAPDAGLACDGASLSPKDLADLSIFPWPIESDFLNNWYSKPLTVGDIGCAQSHLNCWQHAFDAGAPLTLILEDDALLRKTFWSEMEAALLELAELHEDWQLLYFFRRPICENEGRVSARIVRPGYSHDLTAYLVTRDGLRGLIDGGLGDALVHSDEYVPAMYCDHPRQDMRERFPKRIKALAIEPDTAWPMVKWFGSETQRSQFLHDV